MAGSLLVATCAVILAFGSSTVKSQDVMVVGGMVK